MREQLPRVAAVFRAGDIDYRAFQTLVYRTELIEDRQVLAAVDAQLAGAGGALGAQIDKIVASVDADALRRRKEHHSDRQIRIDEGIGGISQIEGTLVTPDAQVLDRRLSALAATVCEHDPRSRDQRRADALGALAAGGSSGWAVAAGAAIARPESGPRQAR
ncbi:hypothetical protein A4G28_17870 [Mycobacterium ostraviense]|uniref:DUF222 domain-containing protein n=1 Tax=Mycobacterium ostraviense TaxID=2738409 RepID=A0A163ZMQ9_9MYCO|nr:hypothetical protein A4G28_17870 [Mycobacterium ostraviense]